MCEREEGEKNKVYFESTLPFALKRQKKKKGNKIKHFPKGRTCVLSRAFRKKGKKKSKMATSPMGLVDPHKSVQ